jgi:hypothetical protein
VLLLSADVPGRNAGPPPEPSVSTPTIDDPQMMKATTSATALTRSARLHRFQSDFRSCIGYLSASGEFTRIAEAGVKSTARKYPPDGARSCPAGEPWAGSGRRSETIHPPDEAIALSFGVGSQLRSSPSDPARNTASARVLTVSFRKIFLAWDFTVSGEILRARATCLLESPLPIIVRISRSRAVSGSPARLPGWAERPPALGATRESRVPVKCRTLRSSDPGASVPGVKAASFESGLIDEFLSMGTGCSPAVTTEPARARSFHCVPPKMAVLVHAVWSNPKCFGKSG